MSRIGILTLHGANNFGAVLQNYALQKAIKNMGYEVETIDYRIPQIEANKRLFSFYPTRNPLRLLKTNFWELINLKNAYASNKAFQEFRDSQLSLSKMTYCKENIATAEYDIYIVGSDQIWNQNIIRKGNEECFDLSFTSHKKASYAASCGAIDAMIPRIENIRELDIVTVRENDLRDYLIENGIPAKTVCDPTILLTKEQWESLFSKKETDPFVYLYYIDSGKNEAAKIANHISDTKGIRVRYPKKYDRDSVRYRYGQNTFYEGPIEFLQSIYCSEFVVVASFHGVVFSILMQKQFVALLHKQTGKRVINLLEKLGLQDRIVENYQDYCSREFIPIDYSKVTPLIDNWREESLTELMRICELD